MSWIPNALTLSRFPAAIVMAWLYFGTSYRIAVLAIGTMAFTTDYIDGFIARLFHWESELGAKIEPYADKAACWSLTVILLWASRSDWDVLVPIACAIFAYDIGIGVIRWFFRNKDVRTSSFAKWKTGTLMVGLLFLYAAPFVNAGAQGSVRLIGLASLLTAVYFAIRASAEYLRAYLGPQWVPSVRFLL